MGPWEEKVENLFVAHILKYPKSIKMIIINRTVPILPLGPCPQLPARFPPKAPSNISMRMISKIVPKIILPFYNKISRNYETKGLKRNHQNANDKNRNDKNRCELDVLDTFYMYEMDDSIGYQRYQEQ